MIVKELDTRDLGKVDRDRLDAEWVSFSNIYQMWTELGVEVALELKDIKSKLELLEAQLDLAIRSDCKSYGLEKVTEGAVRSVLIQQPDYQSMQRKLFEKEEQHAYIQGALRTLDKKKDGLENLVKLWLGGYWSEPRIPDEARRKAADGAVQEQTAALSENPRLRRRSGCD